MRTSIEALASGSFPVLIVVFVSNVESLSFGVTGFPTIKFFPKGGKDAPEDVSVERSQAAFIQYVNEKTGTARSADGSLLPTAGRHDELDSIASRFVDAAGHARASLIAEAQSVASSLRGRFAQYVFHNTD
jgi:protein disulfide-isomerase A6